MDQDILPLKSICNVTFYAKIPRRDPGRVRAEEAEAEAGEGGGRRRRRRRRRRRMKKKFSYIGLSFGITHF